MNELKERLTSDLSHVDLVWFDADGNWYLHKGNRTESKTKEDILATGVVEVETKKKKNKD